MRITGRYEHIGTTEHFIPEPLPPENPPFELDAKTTDLYGQATLELGKLNEMSNHLPDIKRFINAYVLKEALLSSAIEGIHTSMLEVFTQPLLESKPNKSTQLVMNYKKAVDASVDLIKKDGLPICSRVILKAHELLLQMGQGDKADPGHYRKQSVRVGNLIPAPALQIPKLMTELEQYINTDTTLPVLIKAGLVHVQFETIHPFLDGNGRIGRLLIVLMLIEKNIITEPIIYPSYYFKKHHLEYYQHLNRVRTDGDFEGWIQFYLTAIRDSCIDAYRRSKDIEALQQELTQIILNEQFAPKAYETRINALSTIFRSPVINITDLSEQLDVSYNTANQIITTFIELDILTEENQQKRGKLFKFKKYLDILEREYK